MKNNLKLSILGNPNCGKTSIFNLLSGLNQKVSNYPGITVEKKITHFNIADNTDVELHDLPGAYSIIPQSLDEEIVTESILKWANKANDRPDALLYVADITNLRRNLFFLTQLLPLNIPIILLLNMSDLFNENMIDINLLKTKLGLHEVILFSATKKTGLNKLKKAITVISKNTDISHNSLCISEQYQTLIAPLRKKMKAIFNTSTEMANQLSFSLLCNRELLKNLKLSGDNLHSIVSAKTKIIDTIDKSMKPNLNTMDSDLRYIFIDEILSSSNFSDNINIKKISASEKIDKVLTHAFFGPFLYVCILYFIFQSIFSWSGIPMDFIDSIIGNFGNYIFSIMPEGLLRDLTVDGIIAGVGGIVIFLPQILLLMFFMSLLEDTGYMTRISFIMDKFMRKMGLHGKSILPIMSGYACAIPGIISTRSIDSWKERLITILILPLISCSARLPVYVLMIGAFIPDIYLYNFIGLQGLVMVIMYFLGTITAFILAKLFSSYLSEKSNPSFIMELPPYRIPLFKSIFRQVYNRGKLFLINAGQIIMAISIVLWFLVSFPRNNSEAVLIENSYAGKVGHFIEPAIAPLGFDWKIGIGLITSFAAREVVVSTLSTIYNVEDDGESMVSLREAMKNDVNPKTGKNVYTPLVAISLMVFYVYAAQCMVTFAVVRTETNTWKWPIFMIGYMTLLAYLMSFIVFQGGRFLGFI